MMSIGKPNMKLIIKFSISNKTVRKMDVNKKL